MLGGRTHLSIWPLRGPFALIAVSNVTIWTRRASIVGQMDSLYQVFSFPFPANEQKV